MSCGRGRVLTVATMVLAAFAAFAAVVSCLDRPDLDELLSKPVVVTKRDQSTDFGSLGTFAMKETVPLFTSFDAGTTDATVPPDIADPTLAEVAAQLTSRGYQEVARTAGPDFGVVLTAVSQLEAVTVAYGGWWGSGGGAYWGYSGGVGSTIGYSSVVSWQSGTLIIELYDLRAARDEALRSGVDPTVALPTSTVPIPVVWGAILHGVFPPGGTIEAPPIQEIRQAFIQSPYLVRATPPAEIQ